MHDTLRYLYTQTYNHEDDNPGEMVDADYKGKEGEGYKWIAGVAKSHKIAFVERDEFCRECGKEIEDEDYETNAVIDCNMCHFVFCLSCLSPPITANRCVNNDFFACTGPRA